jgi:hypothetical protein
MFYCNGVTVSRRLDLETYIQSILFLFIISSIPTQAHEKYHAMNHILLKVLSYWLYLDDLLICSR